MIIYDTDGVKLLDIEVDDTSVRYKAIKGDNSLTLRFSLANHLEFPLGSWCEFKGETYSLMASSDITLHHRRNFEYSLVMYGDEAKAKRFKFINPSDGQLKFVLTAYPEEHLQMFVDNMNNREPVGKKDWKIGECVKHERVTLSYNHTYCHDALVQLAEELELDYWFEGKTVYLGKLEVNKLQPLPLSYGGDGEGLKAGIKRANFSDALPIEILYVQGSDKNIDLGKYKSKELHMPYKAQVAYDGVHFHDEDGFDESSARWYITDENGYSVRRTDKEQTTYAEDSLDCTEITPTKDETIKQVILVNEKEHFYDLLFESDVDYSKYQIAGETPYIVFQKGMLAGKEFDLVTYDNGTIKSKQENGLWRIEIKPQEIDGILMPDSESSYVPLEGETFKVFGIQLPDEYIKAAEWDVFKYAVKHLYANEVPQYTIVGELDEIYSKKNWNWIKDKIVLGGYISFSDRSFQEDAILIRITGIKEYVNKPYSPQLELSNQNIGGTLIGTLNRIENQEVYNEALYRNSVNFSKRRFRDAQETITMLEKAMLDGFTETVSPIAVKTMAMLVGDESLQFRFVDSMTNPKKVDDTLQYDTLTKKVISEAGIIQHMTLGIKQFSNSFDANVYKFWNVKAYDSQPADADKSYYLYIKARKDNQDAEYDLRENAIGLNEDSTYYYFLTAILNKEVEGTRSFVTLYGFTEVLPGQVSTDLIRSADGSCYFDLANNEIGGVIKFQAGSEGLENIMGDMNIGGQNMLRNSGFTGDYLSEPLADGNVLDAASKLYNDPLMHWENSQGVKVEAEAESQSGYAVRVYSDGALNQTLYNSTIAGESYVVSFKAKGKGRLAVALYDNVTIDIDSEDKYTRYILNFVPTQGYSIFSILAYEEMMICEVQLERGTIATAWGMSPLDNSSDRTYYESLKHLDNVLNDGSTTVGGGLVLTNEIHVGNYKDKVMIESTGGMSGVWSKPEDPFLWGGGTKEEANNAVAENGKTEANFVVTHGGKVILNDARVRGDVYAQNGIFGGRLQMNFTHIYGGEFLLSDLSSSAIWMDRLGFIDTTLVLPQDDTYDGWVLNVFAYPRMTKPEGSCFVRGSILYPTEQETVTDINLDEGGFLAFTYSSQVSKWILTNELVERRNFRYRVTNISESNTSSAPYQLRRDEHTIIVHFDTTGSAVYLKLPTNPKDGQQYMIYTCDNEIDLYIMSNYENLYDIHTGNIRGGDNGNAAFTENHRRKVLITYSDASSRWYMSYDYLS